MFFLSEALPAGPCLSPFLRLEAFRTRAPVKSLDLQTSPHHLLFPATLIALQIFLFGLSGRLTHCRRLLSPFHKKLIPFCKPIIISVFFTKRGHLDRVVGYKCWLGVVLFAFFAKNLIYEFPFSHFCRNLYSY